MSCPEHYKNDRSCEFFCYYNELTQRTTSAPIKPPTSATLAAMPAALPLTRLTAPLPLPDEALDAPDEAADEAPEAPAAPEEAPDAPAEAPEGAEEMSATGLGGTKGAVAVGAAVAEREAAPHSCDWRASAGALSEPWHSAWRHVAAMAWKFASVQTQVMFVAERHEELAAARVMQLAAQGESEPAPLIAGALADADFAAEDASAALLLVPADEEAARAAPARASSARTVERITKLVVLVRRKERG